MLPGSRFPSEDCYSLVLDKALHATTIKLAGSANPSFLLLQTSRFPSYLQYLIPSNHTPAMSAINKYPAESVDKKEKREHAVDGLEAGDESDGPLSFTALIQEGEN